MILEPDAGRERAPPANEAVEALLGRDVAAGEREEADRTRVEILVRGLVVGEDQILGLVAVLEVIVDALPDPSSER